MLALLDNFVGANGTALASHSPDTGGPWTDQSAGWQIESNAAQANTDGCASHAPVNQKISTAQVKFNLNGMIAGAAFGCQMIDGTDNGWGFSITGAGVWTARVDTTAYGGVYQQVSHASFASGDHLLQVNWGPTLVKFILDGNVVAVMPRAVPTTTPLPTFYMSASFASGNGPIVKQVTVGN